jgi:hypothetical protein
MTAAHRLDAALAAMAERGHRPPCTSGTDRLWFGSTSTHRAEAARICRNRCPVVDECRAAADELPARYGVWGGRDYTPKAARRRRADVELDALLLDTDVPT